MDRPHVKPRIIHGNALDLPLEDESVDLICTSPPYFGLRSYQDGGEHYDGQIGSEATPAEFVDALIAATREMVRVLKPSGSIFVNLGDKYAGSGMGGNTSLANSEDYKDQRARGYHPCQNIAAKDGSTGTGLNATTSASAGHASTNGSRKDLGGIRNKSLVGLPWRYALRCIDDLGLILRAEIIWSKPNGLPESVTDRVRRSHETWFHFTKSPRYFSAVDEIREPHSAAWGPIDRVRGRRNVNPDGTPDGGMVERPNPLGKLPGSVWTIPTEPLRVPDHLGIDHFAAFPTEWPRRIISGWSPRGVCVECGEGRRPVVETTRHPVQKTYNGTRTALREALGKTGAGKGSPSPFPATTSAVITGYACACPEPTAPTTPGTVLDPFGGTGTTALVADVLGRHGISVDMSADYCRLAEWRTTDPGQRAKAARVEPPPAIPDGQLSLFGEPA